MTFDGYSRIGPEQSFTNDGYVTVRGTLVVDTSIAGDGNIGIESGATLDITGGIAQPIFFFQDAVLEVADPIAVTSTLYNFDFLPVSDVIDLTGVAYSSADSVTYGADLITVKEGSATVASFKLEGYETAGTVFTLESDGENGTEIAVERSVGNRSLSTSSLQSVQVMLLNEALEALSTYVAQSEGVTHPGLNFFTPPPLVGNGAPVSGDVNIENGSPISSKATIALAANVQGVVLTGGDETIIGRAGTELLVGGFGNETIHAAGGSGTIISGQGRNEIYTGSGDVVVSSDGDDTIYSGRSGNAEITAYSSATVHAGGGFTSFTDSTFTDASVTSADKVKGGSGTAIMNSGLGQDTFVGGTGTSFMNDTGSGRVALVFNKGVGGTDIVTGFDPGNGDYIRSTAASNGWADFQNNISVIGGSSFVNLADGTKIEFVGFTSLSEADFHA